MQPKHFAKAAVLAVLLVLAFLAIWEAYWRNKGFPISYNDDKDLWSNQRRQVYQPADQATIFIGSSRIKFDLDVPLWEELTGNQAIQLSCVGTSPRPLLHDLANDNKFKGRVIIDITEGLFYGRNTKRTEKSARERIEYFKKWTPAQRISAAINYPLESTFVFLDEDKFSLEALLDDLGIPNRPGVNVRPPFPKEFGLTTINRQDYMTDMFLNDTNLIRRQTNIWSGGIGMTTSAISGDSLMMIIDEVKKSVDKIRSRRGDVLFVRTTSSGKFLETEDKYYPRDKYWEPLLQHTRSEGIHFKDYPVLANMICPEWSHLGPNDVRIFTKELIKILEVEKGWNFKKNTQSLAKS